MSWLLVPVVAAIIITLWGFATWIADLRERSRTSTTSPPKRRGAAHMREDSSTRKGKGSSVPSHSYLEQASSD